MSGLVQTQYRPAFKERRLRRGINLLVSQNDVSEQS